LPTRGELALGLVVLVSGPVLVMTVVVPPVMAVMTAMGLVLVLVSVVAHRHGPGLIRRLRLVHSPGRQDQDGQYEPQES
jgi:hypothetical protein